jgi:hypothetical protein
MRLLAPYLVNGSARALVADTSGLTLRSVSLESPDEVEKAASASQR